MTLDPPTTATTLTGVAAVIQAVAHSYLKNNAATNAVRAALDHVNGFRGAGGPDPNTVDVLNEALSRLER
jgi:hypothetical protein